MKRASILYPGWSFRPTPIFATRSRGANSATIGHFARFIMLQNRGWTFRNPEIVRRWSALIVTTENVPAMRYRKLRARSSVSLFAAGVSAGT